MDFRETQSNAKTFQQIVQRWLREFVFEDWWLKLIALAVALALWFGVSALRAPATLHLRGIKLVFIVPSDMEISNVVRDEVSVTLEGSQDALDSLNVRDLVANVNVGDYKPGERVILLSPDRFKIKLPAGVRVKEIEPASVPLRIEQLAEQEVAVEARLEGSVPSGYELVSVSVAPDKIKLRGPVSQLKAWQKAPTETISLDGRTENFMNEKVAIDIPDAKITALTNFVNVHVVIAAKDQGETPAVVDAK